MVEEYDMTHSKRGVALIVNINKFQNDCLKEREGSLKDLENLKKSLGPDVLGFEIETCLDKSSADITNCIREYSIRNHKDHDCSFLMLSSHGGEGFIYAYDGKKVFIKDLIELIKECESLVGKPKFIFVQACRGEKHFQSSFPLNNDLNSYAVDESSTTKAYLDFFICYATIENHVAYRDPNLGSIFITQLCDIFNQFGTSETFDDLILILNREVGPYQVSSSDNRLQKRVYFKRKKILLEKDFSSVEASENQALDLLYEYFRPLASYKRSESKSIIDEPLWFFKQKSIDSKEIFKKMELIGSSIEDRNLKTLLMLVIDINKDINICFDQLKEICQRTIIDLINKDQTPLSKYAISLLITLLLRNKSNLDNAINYLKTGEFNAEFNFLKSNEIVTFSNKSKSPSNHLIYSHFIQMTGANFLNLKEVDSLDLIGQNMHDMNANRCILTKCKLRYCNLENSFFDASNMYKCDFENSNLFEACFRTTIANECRYEKCSFARANLSGGSRFRTCYFGKSDFEDSNLSDADFENSNFVDVINLSSMQLKSGRSFEKCLFSSSIYVLNETVLRNAECFKENSVENFKIEEFFKKEKINVKSCSMNWPQHKWVHDPEWNGDDEIQEINILDKSSQLFRFVSFLTELTSENISYKPIPCEIARLYKIFQTKNLISVINQIRKELPDFLPYFIKKNYRDSTFNISGTPSHQGYSESIKIKEIMVIKNPEIWKRYQEAKTKLKSKKSPLLGSIKWHSMENNNQIKFKPLLDDNCGECYLFHGTSQQNVKQIIKNGFTTKYVRKKPIFGYGALGKGVYFSDSFSKATIYTPCPMCKQIQCECKLANKQLLNQYKCVMLCRVLLGNVYFDPNRERQKKEYPPPDFDSSYGPDSNNSISTSKSIMPAFDCNEFCVPSDLNDQEERISQVYPEYLIFYEENKELNSAYQIDSLLSVKNFFIQKDEWESKIKKPLKDKLVHFNELNKSIIDYLNILHFNPTDYEKRLIHLNGNLKASIDKCFNDLRNKVDPNRLIESNLEKIKQAWAKEKRHLDELLNKSHYYSNKLNEVTRQLEIKTTSYFVKHLWTEAILALDELIKLKTNAYNYRLRSYVYLQLKKWDEYIVCARKSIELSNEQVTFSDIEIFDKDTYFRVSLKQLYESNVFHFGQDYYEVWLRSIADWLTKDVNLAFEDWQYFYWSLSNPKEMEIFKNSMQDENLKNSLPNDNFFQETCRKCKENWHSTFFSYLLSEKATDAEISWLDEHNKIVKGSLQSEFVDHLLSNLDVSLKEKLITFEKSNKKFAIIKLYPQAALKQIAIQEFLYRLNGLSSFSILAKVRFPKQNLLVPILISKTNASNSIKETSLEIIDKSMNQFYFTWKLIETYLLQQQDYTINDISIDDEIYSSRNFYYTNLNNQHTLGNRQIKTFAYLFDSMSKQVHPAVVKSLLKLNNFELFLNEWLQYLKTKFKYLFQNEEEDKFDEFLFNRKEIESLHNKNASLDDLCFSNHDLTSLYDRMKRLKQVISSLNSKINENRKLLEASDILDINKHSNKITNFDLLKELDINQYLIYVRAFRSSSTIIERFKSLQNDLTFYVNDYKSNKLERVNNLNRQVKDLEYHIKMMNLFFQWRKEKCSANAQKLSILNEPNLINYLNWSLLPEENVKYILKQLGKQRFETNLDVMRLRNCSTLTDSLLKKILKRQKSVTELHLEKCDQISERIISTNLPHLRCLILTAQNYDRMNISDSFIYLESLHLCYLKKFNYLSIRNLKGSKLKRLFIESCPALVEINICLYSLQEMTLNDLNMLTTLKFNYFNNECEFTSLKEIREEKFQRKSFNLEFHTKSKQNKLKIVNVYNISSANLFKSQGWKFLMGRNDSTYLDAFFQQNINKIFVRKVIKIHHPEEEDKAICLTETLDGKYLLSGSTNGKVSAWDIKTNSVNKILIDRKYAILLIKVLSDQYLALCSSNDKSIQIWDIKSGLLKHQFKKHTGHVVSLALLPNDLLVSSSEDCTINIWNIKGWSWKQTISVHIDTVTSLCVLPYNRLASCSKDKSIVVINLENGLFKKRQQAHDDNIICLTLLPNGLLASGSFDKKINIWSLEDLTLKQTLTYHTRSITSMVILANRYLLSGSLDSTLGIFDSEKNYSLVKAIKLNDSVLCLTILANGDLAVGLDKNSIKILAFK